MVGFAMIECGARNRILVFLAFLSIFLGGGTAPRMTLYAAALIMVAAWRVGAFAVNGRRERWLPLGLMAGAAVLTAIIFSVMIHFKFKEFWEMFHESSQRVDSDSIIKFILTHLSCKEEVLWFLFAVAIFFVLRRPPKDDLTRICMVLTPIIPIEILTKLTAHGASLWYTLLVCLFLAAVLSKQISALGKAALQIGLVLALLFFNCEIIFYAIGMLSGRIRETEKQESLPVQAQGHAVFVDCAAARYYFHYQIPKGCIDFFFSVPFPDSTPLQGTVNPTDIYLIGPANVDFLKEYGGLDYQSPAKWSPAGFSRLSFYKYPRQIFVITPDLCKGIKKNFW